MEQANLISGFIDQKGIFKIIDQRHFIGRKYGKNCMYYSRAELENIASYLGLYNKAGTKQQICNDIQQVLIPSEGQSYSNIENLPDEKLFEICEGLDVTDLSHLVRSSKHIHNICQEILDKRKGPVLEERQQQKDIKEFNGDIPRIARETYGFKRSSKLEEDLPKKKYQKYLVEVPLTRYQTVNGYILIQPEDFPNLINILKTYYSLPHTEAEWKLIKDTFESDDGEDDIFEYYSRAVNKKLRGKTVKRSELMGDLRFFEGVDFRETDDGNTLIIHVHYGS